MINLVVPPQGEVEDAWTTNLLLVATLLSSLVTLGRQLPLQNALVVVALTSFAGAGWAEFAEKALEFRGAHWQTGIFWGMVFLNARGAAQFFLRSRRSHRFHGWHLTALTGLIFTLAVGALCYWMLNRAAGFLFLSFFASAGLCVVLLPLLMNKRPVEPPVSWQPIVVLPLLLVWAFLPRI